jgi:hypothetical protein
MTCVYYKAVVPTADDPDVFQSLHKNGHEVVFWRVGHTNTLPEVEGKPLALNKYGFHACMHPAAPFVEDLYYRYKRHSSKLLEVRLHGKVVSDGIKAAALSCEVVRVVSDEEYEALVKGETVLRGTEMMCALVKGETVLRGTEMMCICAVHLVDGVCTGVRTVFSDGLEEWRLNGSLHRGDGKPARIKPEVSVARHWHGLLEKNPSQSK